MRCDKCNSSHVFRVSHRVYCCADCHVYIKPIWEPADYMLDSIESFCNKYPNASSGPAHIVLDDYNLGDGHIIWCQKLIKEAILYRFGVVVADPDEVSVTLKFYSEKESDGDYRHSLTELAATYDFLDFLLTIPEEKRDILNGTYE